MCCRTVMGRGRRRDLVLLLRDTTGDISSQLCPKLPQHDYPKLSSQRVRLPLCPLEVALKRILSTTKMLQGLPVLKRCMSRTLGDAEAQHHLTEHPCSANPSTWHQCNGLAVTTTAVAEKGLGMFSSTVGLLQGLSAAAAGAEHLAPTPATNHSHSWLLSLQFHGSLLVSSS